MVQETPNHFSGVDPYGSLNLGILAITCDGVVTGIQIKALAGDIAAYRSIKKPQ